MPIFNCADYTTRLLESNESFNVTPYLTKGIKAPVEKIQASVDGKMCAEQSEKLRIIRSHMDALELCKLNLQSLILTIADRLLPQIDIVATVPGIQAFSAIGVISVDMSVFPTSKHLRSWAGHTPQNNESAGKKKTTRISRAGAYIKPLLVQCALCAVRTKQFPEIRHRYLALKKRRGHKKAIIAIARMLLTAIYNMLKKMSRTILTSIAGLTSLPHTARFLLRRLST